MKNLHKVLLIAQSTLKEIMKSRILYGTAIIALSIILVTYVAKEFTYGVPGKVAIDFGLGMLSLSSLGIALFIGATLLSKEIETRTVYMVISRPVPRWCFILGKLVGLTGVLTINVVALSLLTLFCSSLNGGEIDQVIIMAMIFNLIEAILLMLVVVFFSLFMNSILASLMCFFILVAGHAVQVTLKTGFVLNRPLVGKLIEAYHLFLPGFYKLNLKDFAVHHKTIETGYLVDAFLYGTSYSLFVFFLILYIFQRKNLD